jgi:putative ABC transport system permease protein
MKQQITEVVLGLLMLAVPFFVMYKHNINMAGKAISTLLKVGLGLFLISLLLYIIIDMKSIPLTILFLLMSAFLGASISIHNARLKITRLLLPVSIGFFVTSSLIGILFVMSVVWNFSTFYDLLTPFIAAVCLLIWFITYVNTKALSTYYMGLNHHNQLYDYLIGNGATHEEATNYFFHRAIQIAISSSLRSMSLIIGFTMAMFWTYIFVSSDVMHSLSVLFLFLCAVFCSGVLSVVITLRIAQKFSFDKYGRLKNITKKPKNDKTLVDSPS